MTENTILFDKNILIHYNVICETNIGYNFCGIVYDTNEVEITTNYYIYIAGDIEQIYNKIKHNKNIFIIRDLSYNFEMIENDVQIINIGKVPINIYNVGIYFEQFFDMKIDYFNKLRDEHQFQSLTESNKSSMAFRKGIYITNVEKDNNDDLHFHLLRCSSNLEGSTDNMRETDNEIMQNVNNIVQYFFGKKTDLNHVLAQIYENDIQNNRKAKIKDHSDKTKDMPRNGLMAFCTFYKYDENIKYSEPVYTKLRFRLKPMVNDIRLNKLFDIVLYPNSVFLMPLSTNKLYTHEIIPSNFPIEKLPIRMGYVIRCSKTKAIYKNETNKTYIIENNNEHKELKEPDEEGIMELKKLYFKENTKDEIIEYGKFYFSLNKGDYMRPNI